PKREWYPDDIAYSASVRYNRNKLMVTESGLKRNLSYLWPRWHIVLRYGMREVGHMQTGKRVYPRQREPGKWLSYLLLFLSAVVVISGVVSRGGDLTIEPAATATPIPTDAY